MRKAQHSRLRISISTRVAVSLVASAVFLFTSVFNTPAPISAQPLSDKQEELDPLSVSATNERLLIEWQPRVSESAASEEDWRLDLQPFGPYMLPLRTVTVQLKGEVMTSAVTSLDSVPWNGELESAPQLEPAVLEWDAPLLLRDPAPEEALPNQPIFLLRSGRMRGELIAIYAVSEIYQDENGQLRRVTGMRAEIPGVQKLLEGASVQAEISDTIAVESANGIEGKPPSNPLASKYAVKLFVAEEGIHEVSASALSSVGITQPKVNNLRLYHRGAELALHVKDPDGNGILTGAETVRFYAHRPGDLWNMKDVYWLHVDNSPGKRMVARDVSPGSAPLRTTAYAHGHWEDNRRYESTTPSPDGDRWFHSMATMQPTSPPSEEPAIAAPLKSQLPFAPNANFESIYEIGVTAIDIFSSRTMPNVIPHHLSLSGGSVNYTDSASDWVVDFGSGESRSAVRRITTAGVTDKLLVRLAPSSVKTQVFFDKIEWWQPARLQFGGKGAAFSGLNGSWRYQLTQTPVHATLYDVTDPQNPAILAKTNSTMLEFEDGPDARNYVLAGDGDVHKPQLEAHTPIELMTIQGVDVVYISPQVFEDALEPLIMERRLSGHKTRFVDVQEIYDGWSYGAIDPNAIRDFLQYAVMKWKPALKSVVLVGDGTYDPHGYLGFDVPNHIPPYLADVDPWIGENACESCYAQLDGDDPLSEKAFLTDIWIGRFPVATVSELQTIVQKILSYERGAESIQSWQGVSVQIADDWILSNGEKDGAGNFAYYVENISRLQPIGVQLLKHYYNAEVPPELLDTYARNWLFSIRWWIESNPSVAQRKTFELINDGAGLVTFTGHSNHWAWGRMGPTAGYEHRLFGLWDVLELKNKDKLFLGLSMTCLSAQFTKPESSHFTLDEHLVLHPNGGAVAMWGPAGLSVASGHDALQKGFYAKLWSSSATPATTPIGALVQAGYNHIALEETCCQDVVKTFVLLGDPLTPLRFTDLERAYLPDVGKTPID